MPVDVHFKSNMEEGKEITLHLQNNIDWDFTKWNPGIVKTAQNLREFDKWITWIKNTFDMNVPFNYLEIGSYAGESLYYLSQVFPKGSQITLVDLGDNHAAREILMRVCKFITIEYGHKINLLSGYSNTPEILQKVMAYPVGQALYDMVFIDANHDFKWAFSDYMNYRDKAVWSAFHDISDFNVVKNLHKYGKDIANAAHLWKSITAVIPQTDPQMGLLWDQFIDFDNNTDMSKMDIKPRGIGVLKN